MRERFTSNGAVRSSWVVVACLATLVSGCGETAAPPTLVSISLTPTDMYLDDGDMTEQMTATGLFSDDGTANITELVTWLSDDELLATVSDAAGSKGQVTSNNTCDDGTVTISATEPTSGIDGEAMVLVEASNAC